MQLSYFDGETVERVSWETWDELTITFKNGVILRVRTTAELLMVSAERKISDDIPFPNGEGPDATG